MPLDTGSPQLVRLKPVRARIGLRAQASRLGLLPVFAAMVFATSPCAHAAPNPPRDADPRAASIRPGLWDAHVHVCSYGDSALDSLVAYGVVAVRDCGGDAIQLRRWRDEIAAGKRRGPRITFAGPILDGPSDAPFHLPLATQEQAKRAVDSLAALGVDFIKTHQAIKPDVYFAVLRAARAHGLPLVSHLPPGVPAWQAADSGVACIEHMAESIMASPIGMGYAKRISEAIAWWNSPAGDSAVSKIARSGAAVTPTLVGYECWMKTAETPQAAQGRATALAFQKAMTGRLFHAGVPILVGTDFGDWKEGPQPGRSLAREIELLVESGLTREEALAAATTVPERWMRKSLTPAARDSTKR